MRAAERRFGCDPGRAAFHDLAPEAPVCPGSRSPLAPRGNQPRARTTALRFPRVGERVTAGRRPRLYPNLRLHGLREREGPLEGPLPIGVWGNPVLSAFRGIGQSPVHSTVRPVTTRRRAFRVPSMEAFPTITRAFSRRFTEVLNPEFRSW